MASIITLTTDFGLQDHYVSAIKAAILGIAPDVRLVDISHQIPPQDIMAGAWVVRNATMLYPPNTVHLVVIDPGVGTDRNPVAIKIEDQYFVGPDNGIFSLIGEDFEYEAVVLDNEKFWRKDRSHTFHGRDIFAPVAAHLSKGLNISHLGRSLEKLVTFRWAIPISDRDGVQGWIVHIDRFGNLISNIPESLIKEAVNSSQFRIYVGNTILKNIVLTYGDVPDGEPAAYIGSSGTLEVAINKGNAKEMLGVEKGAQISIINQK
ncbi:MAG: SAM-dependent chlorinase/fluorinase [Balneolaceae bacterium]|nr:SAM-dependent chlorinase/fluorinase [Balneolaceae bacterium]